MDELIKKCNDEIKNLPYDKNIENLNNIKIINELVYNTYYMNNCNYLY